MAEALARELVKESNIEILLGNAGAPLRSARRILELRSLRRRQRPARAIRRRQQVCRVALDCRAAPPRRRKHPCRYGGSCAADQGRPRHARSDLRWCIPRKHGRQADVFQKPLEGRPLHRPAGQASIVVYVRKHDLAGMTLAHDIGFASLPLGIERIEFLLEALVGRFAGVDGAADGQPGSDAISPRHRPLSRLR